MNTLVLRGWSTWLFLGVGALACRPDPGVPDYSSHIGLRDPPDTAAEFLPGPNPFERGTPRLYLGAFYEGEATDEILINDVDTHYYIFENSYQQQSSAERVEGRLSDQLELNGTPFWGGGLIWDVAKDLTDWTTLYVSLRSDAGSFADVPIILQSQSGDRVVDAKISAIDYGYQNDGQWHNLRVPLSDLTGFDPATTRAPFILSAPGGTGGDTLLVDDLYFTQE